MVFPEQEMALRLARNLANGDILNFIELSEEYSIMECRCPRQWQGKSIRELDVRARHRLNIIAIRQGGRHDHLPPEVSTPFRRRTSWWCWDGTRISERWSGCERGVDTSRKNPLLVQIRRLASSRGARRSAGMFLGDGVKLLEEALKWGAPLETVVYSEGLDGPELPPEVRTVRVPEDVMASISPMESPQGALFLCRMWDTAPRPAWRAGAIWCWTVSRTRGT